MSSPHDLINDDTPASEPAFEYEYCPTSPGKRATIKPVVAGPHKDAQESPAPDDVTVNSKGNAKEGAIRDGTTVHEYLTKPVTDGTFESKEQKVVLEEASPTNETTLVTAKSAFLAA